MKLNFISQKINFLKGGQNFGGKSPEVRKNDKFEK
jgi:hypothetical protein